MAGALLEMTDDNFTQLVSQGLVLVDFFAEWCGPCHMQTPILEQLAAEMKDQVRVFKLDIEAAQKTTTQFQVTSVPTLILFKDGKEWKRVVGLRDLATLKTLIQSASK
ncbi:MAG: thioredoxin [Verrucomicrobia bacterium]|nr:thioredoxin [Verrucomicrobiota bacterium]